ncbi:MAG: hypothetical protein ACOX9B_12245 [Candidatus Xenobium sp.]|jgi:hypothetical protein|nr:hypothetical protein [Burkholderiales bacterium]
MPHFRFKARTWDGKPEEGTLEAASLYDFYAEMNLRGLKVDKVVDVSGLVEAPRAPARRFWPLPVFSLLLVLLFGLLVQTWLVLPFKTIALLLPALAAQTLVALLAWQRARPGPLLGPHLVEELHDAPWWLRWLLAGLTVLAFGQLAALLGKLGLDAPPMMLAVRALLAVGSTVPILITGSGLTAALRGRLS